MLAKGLQLLMGDGGGTEVFTQVTGVTEFVPSPISWATEDVTNNDDTTPVTAIVPTVRTHGPITLVLKPFSELNTQHAALIALSISGAANNFKIYHPGSSIGYMGPFAAVVRLSTQETPVKGIFAARLELAPTGQIADKTAAVVSVTVTDAQAGAYVTGEFIELTATWDEVVAVTGTPRISIALGSGTVFATYTAGTGSNVLTFRKTFGGGDTATASQVVVSSPIGLNGGTINDMIGQAATLTFTPPTTSSFTVN